MQRWRSSEAATRYEESARPAAAKRRYQERLDERRAPIRGAVDRIKIASGCVDCGYRAHPAALDFDHLDPSTKIAAVSAMVYSLRKSWPEIESEIAKCEVVCANCHRIRTLERPRVLGRQTVPRHEAVLSLWGDTL
jgi:hypothetical protein